MANLHRWFRLGRNYMYHWEIVDENGCPIVMSFRSFFSLEETKRDCEAAMTKLRAA